MDDVFEKQLEKMIGKIELRDIRTYEIIRNDKKALLDKIYGPYMCYANNVENRRDADEKLKHYEYVESPDLLIKRDSVMMIDADQFFEIKCYYQGKFFRYNEPRKILGLRILDRNIQKDYSPNNFWFRKLNKKDILKIMLVESIDQINN
jgi:hypothetical protein